MTHGDVVVTVAEEDIPQETVEDIGEEEVYSQCGEDCLSYGGDCGRYSNRYRFFGRGGSS